MVLCAGAFGCYAAQGSLPGAQGQGYDLNLSYSRTTLKAVADAITQQVGIAFSYETALAGYPMENLEVRRRVPPSRPSLPPYSRLAASTTGWLTKWSC